MSASAYERPGPTPGPPRPISFRVMLTEEEHRRARLVAAHERRFLANIVREDIERRYQALGPGDGRTRPPRRKARVDGHSPDGGRPRRVG